MSESIKFKYTAKGFSANGEMAYTFGSNDLNQLIKNAKKAMLRHGVEEVTIYNSQIEQEEITLKKDSSKSHWRADERHRRN